MDATRVEGILKKLNEGLVEREEIVAMTLLSVLSGQSVFLYGPPGTAKSMIASRMASMFKGARYFEYLMQRFSTPEEVFGPISISELRKDNYVRKTAGFLPEADIAFLDEIWKSSPAILNTLLTIVNEHKFRNGTEVETVPLKALIAASNEFPKENSGLEALYDRFIVRLVVSPIRTKRGFDRMISGERKESDYVVDPITFDEWFRVMTLSKEIGLSKQTLSVIAEIRKGIEKHNKSAEKPIYVSDRRWVKAAQLMRAAAYITSKKEVTPDECLLLVHCLWSDDGDADTVKKIVTEAVESSYGDSSGRYAKWKEDFGMLEQEIGTFLGSAGDSPEKRGFERAATDYRGGERVIMLKAGFEEIRIPEYRVTAKTPHVIAYATDTRTGLSRSVTVGVTPASGNSLRLDIPGHSFLLESVGGQSAKEKRRELRQRLDSMGDELNDISRQMRSNRDVAYVRSPFLGDGANNLLRSLREGRTEEIPAYLKTISALRGKLDGY